VCGILVALLVNHSSKTLAAATNAPDNFNRGNGGLGPSWASTAGGGLAISSQVVTGTSHSGVSGDIRAAAYSANQYSQVEVTSAQLTGKQWIGPMVRAENGGRDGYVGIYYWNNGSPELMIFKRSGGKWAQLGKPYSSGPLAAGTRLKLMAVGNTLEFMENGTVRIAVGDNSFSGGVPGIMANGTAKADNWSGGAAGFGVHYLGTAADGVESYDVISAENGYGVHVMRVLRPAHPAPRMPHNFLFVLPVEAGLGSSFGDGLETLRALNAQDRYNLTIVEPSFAIDPWYANNPANAHLRYETFITREVVPWVDKNLATTGDEQNWLIGFSKSGLGAQDLILKYPRLFASAASWDFPAEMSKYDQYNDSAGSYGTSANFQGNYRLTPAFVRAHREPFLHSKRIWIGGYSLYLADVLAYDRVLTSEGVAHSMEAPLREAAHRWDSGWIPLALTALHRDSINLPPRR
jgi:hypothetical protein